MRNDTAKLVLLVALLLAAGGGAGVYFLWFQAGTQVRSGGNAPAQLENAPATNQPKIDPRDFDPRPDPVVSQKPDSPLVLDAAKPLRRLVVHGRVLDEAGSPVAAVDVDFQGLGSLGSLHGAGITDPGGRYSFLAWERTRSRRAPGANTGGWVYARASDGRNATGTEIKFDPCPVIEMADLKLATQAQIDGRIVDAEGAPAPFAQINLRSNGTLLLVDELYGAASQEQRQVVRTAMADDRGQFSFDALPPGVFALTVDGGYFGVAQQRTEVDLRDGKKRWQEIALTRQNYVRGRLLDQDGQPIEGAVVLLKQASDLKNASGETVNTNPKNFEASRETDRVGERGRNFRRELSQWRSITDSFGRFGFSNLPDVEFALQAAIGKRSAEQNGVRTNREDYSLGLPLDTSIAGTIRDAETHFPVERFDIRISDSGGESSVGPFDRVPHDAVFAWHAAGHFRLINAPPGKRRLRVSATGYVPAWMDIADLQEGERRAGLDVALVPLCKLQLTLSQGTKLLPLEPVMLLFDQHLAYEGGSDEFGEARLAQVAPGEYTIQVQRADGSVLTGTLTVPAKSSHTTRVELAPR